jgi:Core histone H2A/H2B/H3/H4
MGIYLIHYTHLIADPNIDPDLEEVLPPIFPANRAPNGEEEAHPDTSNSGANSNSHARKTVANSAGRRRLTGCAYRERKKRVQLRNDIGPKLKIRKVLPLNRDNTGHPLRRRTQQSSYLYSTNLTLLANALREIKHYQKQVGLVFARNSFNRLVKWICEDELRTPVRWQASALAALQYSAETALGMYFEMLYIPILHPC